MTFLEKFQAKMKALNEPITPIEKPIMELEKPGEWFNVHKMSLPIGLYNKPVAFRLTLEEAEALVTALKPKVYQDTKTNEKTVFFYDVVKQNGKLVKRNLFLPKDTFRDTLTKYSLMHELPSTDFFNERKGEL